MTDSQDLWYNDLDMEGMKMDKTEQILKDLLDKHTNDIITQCQDVVRDCQYVFSDNVSAQAVLAAMDALKLTISNQPIRKWCAMEDCDQEPLEDQAYCPGHLAEYWAEQTNLVGMSRGPGAKVLVKDQFTPQDCWLEGVVRWDGVMYSLAVKDDHGWTTVAFDTVRDMKC